MNSNYNQTTLLSRWSRHSSRLDPNLSRRSLGFNSKAFTGTFLVDTMGLGHILVQLLLPIIPQNSLLHKYPSPPTKVSAKGPISQHAVTAWVLRWGFMFDRAQSVSSQRLKSSYRHRLLHYLQGDDGTDGTFKDVKRTMARLVGLRYVSGILEADDLLITMRSTHYNC
jgi:hypothetical protein